MSAQPTHADIFSAANELCATTITEIEGGLVSQRQSDVAEACRRQEEERAMAEMEKIAAERDEREKQERQKNIEQDRLDIEAVEHVLQARKRALHYEEKRDNTQDNNNNNNNNGDDNDDVSITTPEGLPVRHISIDLVWSIHY